MFVDDDWFDHPHERTKRSKKAFRASGSIAMHTAGNSSSQRRDTEVCVNTAELPCRRLHCMSLCLFYCTVLYTASAICIYDEFSVANETRNRFLKRICGCVGRRERRASTTDRGSAALGCGKHHCSPAEGSIPKE